MKTLQVVLLVLTFLFMSVQVGLTQNKLYNLWGVTAETVDNYSDQELIDSLVSSLSSLPYRPTTRIVFTPDDENIPNPGTYNQIVPTVNNVSDVMGEILDSYYWDWGNGEFQFTKDKIITRLNAFLNDYNISTNTKIWEVGNEVNGDWVYEGNIDSVQATIDTLLKIVKSPSSTIPKKTAITLYFYPNVNCVGGQNNPKYYLMGNWARSLVQNYPEVVNNLDYVFISYYRDANSECNPDIGEGWFWTNEIADLMRLFPNSIVGFGEVGWSTDTPPSWGDRVNIVNSYYSYYPPMAWPYIPWTRACFYWNYQSDCLDPSTGYDFRNSQVWIALDSVMNLYGFNGYKPHPKGNISATKITNTNNEFSLENNYPNPFNPVTNIKYNIPQDLFVSLKVYDISGREVKSLVNEFKNAGNYIISFNASELASGIYFYRIQTGSFVQVKKMILVK